MTTRRTALKGLLAGGLGLALNPGLAFAGGGGDRRLVVVLLRGGLDGLAAVPPVGDADYVSARRGLALEDGVGELDGFFGLHPALAGLLPLWQAGALLPVQAVATPYRSRSHFDGQDVLEAGTTAPQLRRDGWLNRALVAAGTEAIAVAQAVPLILRGAAEVGSVAPGGRAPREQDLAADLQSVYAGDPLFRDALRAGLEGRAMVAEAVGEPERGRRRQGAAPVVGRLAGVLLAELGGPRVAVVELGGWDTHANQGLEEGRLANGLGNLADGLLALKEGLGAAWSQTAVCVVSEFGRTVARNGTRGTDHGTGGAALLLGGAIQGGRVLADWPGLAPAQLHEGRDLRPTTDLRAVLGGLLRDHLGLPIAALRRDVFPGGGWSPVDGLVRS